MYFSLGSIHPPNLPQRSFFLSDPGVLGSDLCVPMSVSKRGLANLTDVTLADQATNSIQADNANMAIQGNALWGSLNVKLE